MSCDYQTIEELEFDTQKDFKEIKKVFENDYSLKHKSKHYGVSGLGSSDYSGYYNEKSFKIKANNPSDPGHFFFTQIKGEILINRNERRIHVKAKLNDLIVYGLPASGIIILAMIIISTNKDFLSFVSPCIIFILVYFYARTQVSKYFQDFKYQFRGRLRDTFTI